MGLRARPGSGNDEPERLLSLLGVAELLGVTYHTARKYRSQDPDFPIPAVLVGHVPGWRVEQIELWRALHPHAGTGRGRPRKDCQTLPPS